MSRDEQKFQKAFILQLKATLGGNSTQANKAREKVNLYRKRLER